MSTKHGIVVLAAGLSRRFPGGNKLLKNFAGRPLVSWVLDQISRTQWDCRYLVLGHDAEKFKPFCDEWGFHAIFNADYETGMGSSIAKAAFEFPNDLLGAAFVPADMPFIQCKVYQEMIDTLHLRASSNRIVRMIANERPGHPVWFGSDYFASLRNLQGDRGARQIIHQHSSQVHLLRTANEGILIDLDTEQSFASYQTLYERSLSSGEYFEAKEILPAQFAPDVPFPRS